MSEEMTCDICGEYTGTNQQVLLHKRSCEKKHQEVQERKTRKPFGQRQQKLHAPEDDRDKFHYRVFNDNWMRDPQRLQKAKDAGYTEVEGYEKPFDVGTNENGTPIKGVLMKIPKEWYEEDQAAKMKEIDRIDESIKNGTLEQRGGDKRYTPLGIKIHGSNSENPR